MKFRQLWTEILRQSKYDDIVFTQKSVRYAWSRVASARWFHDENPIKSVRIFIERHGAEERIKLLEIPEVEGAQTLAFIVDDFVREWAYNTETFLVDSTCEDNLNGYILSTNLLFTQLIQTKIIWSCLRASPICWVKDCP
jgi:hypothetical protein